MGNCHFKTEFEAEQMAGKDPSQLVSAYSLNEGQLSVLILHWQRRFRQGLEGRTQKDEISLCYERDVEGQNYYEEECEVGDERASDPNAVEQSFSGEHVLRLSRPREPLLVNGPSEWGRLEVPLLSL